MQLKPGHIELFVRNPMDAKDFYSQGLGFQIEEIQQESFVWMNLDKLTVLLRPGRSADTPATYQQAPNGIVLYTDDLPAARQKLEENGVEFKGTDGSDQCLTFSDPDGNWFQLVNPNQH